MDQQAQALPACYRHPDRPTRVSCSECGKPICPDCTVDAAVGQKCPECAAPVGRAQTVEVRQTWRVNFGTAPVTLAIIVANVALFLLARASLEADRWLVNNLAQVKPLVADGDWYRVVTASFLHASVFHLGINMYILYLLGPRLERQVGSLAFTALYFASAAAGGAMSQLTGDAFTASGFAVVSLGASGAIFGLFGAWFSASYRHRHTPAGRMMFNQLAVLLVINALFPLIVPNIDWRAHLGGFIAGVAIHQLWTRLIPGRQDAGLQRAGLAGVVGLLSILMVVVF